MSGYGARGDSCPGAGVGSCVMVASTGLFALLALVSGEPWAFMVFGVSVLSTGVSLHFLRDAAGGFAPLAGLAVATVLSLLDASWAPLLGLAALYASVVYVAAFSLEASLFLLSSLILPVYSLGGLSWAGFYSAVVIGSSGVAAYLAVRRGHSFTMLALAPVAFLVDPLVAVAAALSSLAVATAVAGVVEKSGCPFRTDSGMTFIGTLLTLAGVFLGLLGGGMAPEDLWIVVWAVGFIFLEAGVLVPVGPHRPPSS